jgi:hypothetical protein
MEMVKRFRWLGVGAVSLALMACAADSGGGRPTPTPASARPGLLSIAANNFMDTDGNKHRDLSTVVVYIFPDSAQYALPLAADGVFEFTLESADGRPVRHWRFDQRQTAEARRDLAPGPGFVFDLSLLENGSDRIAITEAELVATFHPAGAAGPPLRARTQPLLVGPIGRSGGGPG